MWPRLFLGPRHGLHSSRFASLTLFILKFPLSLLLFVSITVFFFLSEPEPFISSLFSFPFSDLSGIIFYCVLPMSKPLYGSHIPWSRAFSGPGLFLPRQECVPATRFPA